MSEHKRHSDATLMGLSKKELIDYVRMAEHNQEVAEETLAQQAENMKDWAPVRRGKWIETDSLLGKIWVCGSCMEFRGVPYGKLNFCPNCGAKMDRGAEKWRKISPAPQGPGCH